ncbi:MAG TPA: hypothetical protein VMT58_01185, partial [Candidatus Binataceae bacterium]|nr:hypothetical protein [Candidatus Binataceae bacterium]
SMLPLLNKALRYRFEAFSSLGLALIVALWFGSNHLGKAANIAVWGIVVFQLTPSFWRERVFPEHVPPFFTHGLYREYLKPDANVIALPFADVGDSMLWQAETTMYFKLVGGWTGFHPAEFNEWPILRAFRYATYLPDAHEQLGTFLAHYHVDAVADSDSDPDAVYWGRLFSPFSAATRKVGGVTVYSMSPALLRPFDKGTAREMRQSAAAAGVDSLLMAEGRWLAAGNSVEHLNAYRLVHDGALDANWCAGATFGDFPLETGKTKIVRLGSHWFCGLRVGATPDGKAIAGYFGSYEALAPTVARLRKRAAHIYFPFPNDLLSPGAATPSDNSLAGMTFVFDPADLTALASQLRTTAAH